MEAGHPFPEFAGESAVTRRPLAAQLTCLQGGITLPSSYTNGPYRGNLIDKIRTRPEFRQASDITVAFEALCMLGYGDELRTQLNTKLEALRTTGQFCNFKVLAEKTEEAKLEILSGFYPSWKQLVQQN